MNAPIARRPIIAVLGVAYLFLYAPILYVIVFSFNAANSTTIWAGFSFRWYEAVINNRDLYHSAVLSVVIASLAATAATAIGTIVAYTMARFGAFRGRLPFSFAASAPLVIPDIITGIALLVLFVTLQQLTGWPQQRGIFTVVLSHTIGCAAFAVIVLRGRLAEIDESIEEAAQDLGARPIEVFVYIVLPSVLPAMIASWLLCFAMSLDDYIITQFTTGPGTTTLSLMIFSMIRRGVSPDINAVASIYVFVAVIVTILASRLQRTAKLGK